MIASNLKKQLNATNAELSSFIHTEVTQAYHDKELNGDKLVEIKKKLSKYINASKSTPTTNAESPPKDLSNSEQKPSFFPEISKTMQTSPSWYDILKYKQKQYEREERQQKTQFLEKKRKTLNDLQLQLETFKEKKESEKETAKNDHCQLICQVSQLEKIENNRMQNHLLKIKEEKETRDRQLIEALQNRKNMQIEKIEEEKKLLREIEDKEKHDEATAASKRQAEILYYKQVIKENQTKKEQLRRDRDAEKITDAKALEEYSKYLEMEETKRQAELKAREERLQKFMNTASEGAVKQEKHQKKEEELRHLRYIKEKERKEEEIENKVCTAKLNKEKELQETTKHQITYKKQQMLLEKQKSKDQLCMWIAESDKIFNQDIQRVVESKRKSVENNEFIRTQIKAKQKDSYGAMTEREMQLNKGIIQRIITEQD